MRGLLYTPKIVFVPQNGSTEQPKTCFPSLIKI
jgi:hypothetical protein